MGLFIDRHNMFDYTPEQIALDHLKDLEVQEKYGANFFNYFFDYPSESVCCLVEAPSKEAVLAAHRETCGTDDMPTEIIEVTPEGIEAFLGPMLRPQPGEVWDEIAFRTILWVDLADTGSLIQRLGDRRAAAVIGETTALVSGVISESGGGRVVSVARGRVLASFRSASRALESATIVQRRTSAVNVRAPDAISPVRIGINAGEPVTAHDDLFGAAVELAEAACDRAASAQIVVTGAVRDICLGKQFTFLPVGSADLSGAGEPVRLFELQWTPESSAPAATPDEATDLPDGLSHREMEVLKLLATGRSNQQLADELVISLNTVRRHVSNIYTKTGVCNRAQATAYAHRNRLI